MCAQISALLSIKNRKMLQTQKKPKQEFNIKWEDQRKTMSLQEVRAFKNFHIRMANALGDLETTLANAETCKRRFSQKK